MLISLKNVTKIFNTQTVLDNVSADFSEGRIYALVGRNGSGKTLLMKCIIGLVTPTDGELFVRGKRVGKDVDFPNGIGFVLENPAFLPHESGLKNLRYLASIRCRASVERLRECMDIVGLNPDSRKHVGKYSMGMRQRLGIAQAIMENPDILLLDEPMNGLDNGGVDDMCKLFTGLRNEGKTIILASHNRADIEILCDTVFEMDAGRLTLLDKATAPQ